MRVLVTGLDGFTGQYVKSELNKHGHIVEGLASNLMDAAGLAAEIKEKQPEALIHLAAVAFVGHESAVDFYQVNLIGTRNLLEALAQHASGLKSVLLASSANVYGNSNEGVFSEESPPNPANDYAVSKLAMEHMAKLWLNKLPLFIVRPFNYTGVGQSVDFLIPKVVSHFKNKAPFIELGNLDVWRDFSDVRFVANAYVCLIENPPIGKIVNVCSSTTYSLRDVLSLCETISGHQLDVRVNPVFVRKNEVKVLGGDATRLKLLIGDRGVISLEDTLRWMLEMPRVLHD